MVVLAILVISLLASGCEAPTKQEVIKLGHGLDTAHPVHRALVYMAKRTLEASGGKLRVDIYPSQQLGTEREMVELLQIGSLDMTKVSASVLESFVPSFKVFSLPYVFRDDAHRFRVLEGRIGKELLLESEPMRIRGLGYYDAGSRSFYTKAGPIREPADLNGLKIRVMQSATAVNMVNTLGGSATPIAWGELYTALQQGVVDGAENNPPSFYASRHYEVCKFYSIDEHTAVPDVLLIGTNTWEELSPAARIWLQTAVDDSIEYQKVLWAEASEHALSEMREAGVEIIQVDKRPFEEKVRGMYEAYRSEPQVYDLLNRIKGLE